jgi:hypothetical protein
LAAVVTDDEDEEEELPPPNMSMTLPKNPDFLGVFRPAAAAFCTGRPETTICFL